MIKVINSFGASLSFVRKGLPARGYHGESRDLMCSFDRSLHSTSFQSSDWKLSIVSLDLAWCHFCRSFFPVMELSIVSEQKFASMPCNLLRITPVFNWIIFSLVGLFGECCSFYGTRISNQYSESAVDVSAMWRPRCRVVSLSMSYTSNKCIRRPTGYRLLMKPAISSSISQWLSSCCVMMLLTMYSMSTPCSRCRWNQPSL